MKKILTILALMSILSVQAQKIDSILIKAQGALDDGKA